MLLKLFAAFVFPLTASIVVMAAADAADPPEDLRWADLVPREISAARKTAKPFFSGATPVDPSAPAPPPLAEGKFMQIKRRQPGDGTPPAVVAELDGRRVQIGGYVVPLDFEATNVKEFLLVPFVGACIHVPPPPANQIIYVKAAKGFDVGETFDPVTVTGIIKTTVAFTGLADAGYTLEAETVTPGKE